MSAILKYEYKGINDKSKDVAMKELNEKPDQVNAHIESFRRWVLSMNHLKCPTDSQFLLRFLRVSKFDHSKAQKRLDNFCTVRSSPRGSPDFFKYTTTNTPVFQKFINSGMHIPLGFNQAGEFILLVRPKTWNPDELPPIEMFKCIFMDLDYFITHEQIQIHGVKILIDLESVGRKAFEIWSDPKIAKQWSRIMQDCYPMRMKGQIFYKEPVIFDVAFQVASFFMNDKMKGRVFRVKNDMNKAMEKIPGLEKILPTEYGGQGGSLQSLIDKAKSQLNEYYKSGNPLASINVDESKRPAETLKHLVEYGEYTGPTLGTAGTFTKYDNVL